jgi:hypothetical protein
MTVAEPPSPEPDEPRLSFKERETLLALRRLANARSQLDQLEEQLAAATREPSWDPDDLARAEAYQREIDELATKAHSRFGGGTARARLAEAEMQQRLVLERLGVTSYDELRTAERVAPIGPAIDPAFVDFARRELASAEEAYRQVLAMPDEPAPEPGLVEPIDLTHPEAS